MERRGAGGKPRGGAVDRIRELYAVERIAKERELDDVDRRALRQKHALAIADELFAWMPATQPKVLPKSPVGGALAYALKLEPALRSYLDDGLLSIENYAAEGALRAVAVGCKNRLFFEREGGGGETAVVILSLVMTAKAIGVDSRIYLRDLMVRIARESDVTKLTPHAWREHFQAEEQATRDAALARFAGA